MKVIIVYSTLTGNTQKVAEGIYDRIKQQQNIEIKITNLADSSEDMTPYDLVVLCYWCRRGTADPRTMAFIETVKDKKIIAIGTLGAYPNSPHGEMLKVNVKKLIEEKNIFIADFTCQGKIDPQRTQARLKIPKGQPHHLDEAGYQRHLESRKHPDMNDIENACQVVMEVLKNEG